MNSNVKPIVMFAELLGFAECISGIYACVTDIEGHPRLRDGEEVRTSIISRVERDADGLVTEFETRNTIYRRKV